MTDSELFNTRPGFCPRCHRSNDCRLPDDTCACTEKQMDAWLSEMLERWHEAEGE